MGSPPRRYRAVVDAEPWTRVVVTTDPAGAEVAAGVLWQAGTAAIEEQEKDGLTILLAGFADRGAANDACAELHRRGLVDAVSEEVIDDGVDGWRPFASVVRAGGFVVVPAWLTAPVPNAGERLLRIEPGRTFGTGSHPTTRLVLTAMEPLVGAATAVLDVGCGSGVLAVAAALLGARSVRAIDIDPDAPAVTAANADRNDVARRVHAGTAPIAELAADPSARFDVVVANLLAPVFADVGPDLVTTLGPGGTLVISGLLANQWHRAVDHLAPLEPLAVSEEDGWVAVVLRRPGEHRARAT